MEPGSRGRTLIALFGALVVVGALLACAPLGEAGERTPGSDGVGRTSQRVPHVFVSTARSVAAPVLVRVRELGRGRLRRLVAPVAALAALVALLARRSRRRLLLPLGSTARRVPLVRRGPPVLAR